jgi:hypothetical protein
MAEYKAQLNQFETGLYFPTCPAFKNALAAGDVRHMAKLGGASGDARYALTPEDIKKIPEITSAPDSVLRGTDSGSLPTIRFVKQYDGTAYYVDAAMDGEGRLTATALQKLPGDAVPQAKNSVFTAGAENGITEAADSEPWLHSNNPLDILKQQAEQKVPEGAGNKANSFKVNIGQQDKHIPGTNNYKQSITKGIKRSILDEDPQQLLDEFAGKGQKLGMNKERVNFGRVIGQYYDDSTGKYIDTTNGIIHYDGKGGAHIVPSRP